MSSLRSPAGAPAPATTSRVGSFRWTVCGLLFLATTINYIDRQVLGILAPDLQHEVGWSELDYGRIVIAFQLSYAVMMLFWGRILDRIGTKLGLALAVTWWSLAAMGTAFARTAMGFGAARFLLGVGEAANFPASIKTVAEWFPKSERAFSTGLFNAGTNVGAVLAPIAVPLIAATWGWRAAFILTGALGFLWVGAWWAIYQPADSHPRLSAAERRYIQDGAEEPLVEKTPLSRILGMRQLWAFAMGKLLTDPIWWFYLFWLPKFLAQEHGVRGVALIPYLTTVYIVADVGSVAGGYLSSALIKRGWTVNASRKLTMGIFAAMIPAVIIAPPGEERLGRRRPDQPGDVMSPGVVGESVHAGVRHVSASGGGDRGRIRRIRRGHRRHPDRRVRRSRAAGGPELLPADVRRRRAGLLRRAGRHPSAGAEAGARTNLTNRPSRRATDGPSSRRRPEEIVSRKIWMFIR